MQAAGAPRRQGGIDHVFLKTPVPERPPERGARPRGPAERTTLAVFIHLDCARTQRTLRQPADLVLTCTLPRPPPSPSPLLSPATALPSSRAPRCRVPLLPEALRPPGGALTTHHLFSFRPPTCSLSSFAAVSRRLTREHAFSSHHGGLSCALMDLPLDGIPPAAAACSAALELQGILTLCGALLHRPASPQLLLSRAAPAPEQVLPANQAGRGSKMPAGEGGARPRGAWVGWVATPPREGQAPSPPLPRVCSPRAAGRGSAPLPPRRLPQGGALWHCHHVRSMCVPQELSVCVASVIAAGARSVAVGEKRPQCRVGLRHRESHAGEQTEGPGAAFGQGAGALSRSRRRSRTPPSTAGSCQTAPRSAESRAARLVS